MLNALTDADAKRECTVSDEHGNVVTITDTGLFIVPDIERLDVALLDAEDDSDIHKVGKGNADRYEYYPEMYDINCYVEDGAFYYWADEAGNGCTGSFQGLSTYGR